MKRPTEKDKVLKIKKQIIDQTLCFSLTCHVLQHEYWKMNDVTDVLAKQGIYSEVIIIA